MIAAFLAAWPTVLAIALCAWAVIATAGCIDANEHARHETARADRAEREVAECVEVQDGLLETLDSFRVANENLFLYIKDHTDEAEFTAAFGRPTLAEQLAAKIAANESQALDDELFLLLNEDQG